MTYDDLIQYYSDLLISQYRNKPRAQASIQALARESLIDNLPTIVRDAFSLDYATGAQLDVVGKYAGVSRSVLTFTGGAVLNDTDYRKLITIALLKNNSNASLKDVDDMLSNFLGNSLLVFDHADTTMGYFFNATFGSQTLAEAVVKIGLLPKPMGVQLSSLIYAGGLSGIYGWGSYKLSATNVSGFQTYDSYTATVDAKRWLRYSDAVNF